MTRCASTRCGANFRSEARSGGWSARVSRCEGLPVVEQAAPTSASVLVHGESGTGKELVAHPPPAQSSRVAAVHPAQLRAIPDTLLESELFGHEKGAFTGAIARRAGAFELANKGTLFLDEIAEMTPVTQAKLIRVLQERSFRALGATREQHVDIRVVAATNVDPQEAVKQGRLREDLFYRLNVFAIELPPLRDRKDDIPLLVQAFIHEFNERNGKNVAGVSDAAMRLLERYNWPGNVRELRNAMERATIVAKGPFIEPADLPPVQADTAAATVAGGSGGLTPGTTVEEAERQLIDITLQHTGGNKTRAAELLGISLKTLHNKAEPDQGRKTGLMRVGIRIKQVLGVLAIVKPDDRGQGPLYTGSITHLLLEQPRSGKADVEQHLPVTFRIAERGGDTVAALGPDEGLRSVLESVAFANAGLVSASICDPSGHIIADAEPSQLGKLVDTAPSLDDLIERQGVFAHLQAIYTQGGQNFEVRRPCNSVPRIWGRYALAFPRSSCRPNSRVRSVLCSRLRPRSRSPLSSRPCFSPIGIAPINMIRGGLARLGQGGSTSTWSCRTNCRTSAPRSSKSRPDWPRTHRARWAARARVRCRSSEDAVALFGPDGTLRFANTAMKTALGLAWTWTTRGFRHCAWTPCCPDHPYVWSSSAPSRTGVTQAAMQVPEAGERLVLTNVVPGSSGEAIGVLLVPRNLAYISQVESTLSYSRKLSALNRLTAGIARNQEPAQRHDDSSRAAQDGGGSAGCDGIRRRDRRSGPAAG